MASEFHAPGHVHPGQGPRMADGHHAGWQLGRGPETRPLRLPSVPRASNGQASSLVPTYDCLTLVQLFCPELWGLSNAQDDGSLPSEDA